MDTIPSFFVLGGAASMPDIDDSSDRSCVKDMSGTDVGSTLLRFPLTKTVVCVGAKVSKTTEAGVTGFRSVCAVCLRRCYSSGENLSTNSVICPSSLLLHLTVDTEQRFIPMLFGITLNGSGQSVSPPITSAAVIVIVVVVSMSCVLCERQSRMHQSSSRTSDGLATHP